jgi:hypothetical protein
MTSKTLAAVAALLVAGGCAVRLGGPSPQTYETLAYEAPASESPEAAASRIASASADVVLLASPADSLWFADVANRTQLQLSGPGRTGEHALAFLTRRLELLGDTSIVLPVPGGGSIHMHDALYQIGKNRLVDLMLVQLDEAVDLREAVRTLLSYIATDVGANAAVVFGLAAPSQQVADSVSVLLRAAYANAWECVGTAQDADRPAMDVRLFYGPSVRMNCQSARVLSAPGNPISARLVVSR